jgi:serine phosphatase RsbU (regulator of sigma subunit)
MRARGMPLGLMPGMDYEEKSFQFQPGDCALLHSDGLAEAHAPDREMFGFPRVAQLVGKGPSGEALIDLCLTELSEFTGPEHEQEDDITLVSLQRSPSAWVTAAGEPRGGA